MKTKQGHSNLADWGLPIGLLVVIFSPWVAALLKADPPWLHLSLSFLTHNVWHISVTGACCFVLMMFWHSFVQYDEFNKVPDISGHWLVAGRENEVVKVEQDGENIKGSFNHGKVTHSYTGHYDIQERAFVIATESRDDGANEGVIRYTERWYAINDRMFAYYTKSNRKREKEGGVNLRDEAP